ncbi:hypothetical protein [Diatraea saccharalis granulovirus]|uniref:Uncharacterized protein n=1 Tax=Diatraea saccharalis granulovirus TaxID=1675862 RepID=A0A0R7EYU4_9BBAC|nr:hypothetical protein [Diatraea saccharalis granulovirus]AKN80732.1 hypothetical protein [Diatraea saccharalis granulovirus]
MTVFNKKRFYDDDNDDDGFCFACGEPLCKPFMINILLCRHTINLCVNCVI